MKINAKYTIWLCILFLVSKTMHLVHLTTINC